MEYFDGTQKPGFENRPPFQTLRENQVDEALERARAPLRLAASWPQPPDPVLFPPRYGYGDYYQRVPSINSVLSIDRYYGSVRQRQDVWQGGPAEIDAGARNVGAATW